MRAGVRDERIFRTVAAVLLVSALSISGYHRHKAERAGEERSPAWREEGLPVAVGLRSAGLALMLSVAAYVLSPRRMEWSRLNLSSWLRWSGAGLGAGEPAPRSLGLQQHRREHNPDGHDGERPRARYRWPLLLGKASPVLRGEYVLGLAEPAGGELVHWPG